jgi:hypothetical protein
VSTPGFTAEKSLYKTSGQYHSGRASAPPGVNLQPALHITGIGGIGIGNICQRFPQLCRCTFVGCNCTRGSDCSTGWCNENNQCDCFDIGDECRFGPQSCCSGHCGADLTCVPPPQISVTYQPPQYPYGHGFPGTLTVTGQNFTRDVDVLLTIDNCDVNPYQFPVHTSAALGNFNKSVPCFCPGTATVKAVDTATGDQANGAANLVPCP